MANTEISTEYKRRNVVLYHLVEGDVMLDQSGNHRVTDGEIWIYADGTVKSSGALTEEIDGELVIDLKSRHQVVNLETLEEI